MNFYRKNNKKKSSADMKMCDHKNGQLTMNSAI